ncbi:hypothetical protein BTUL_0070g00240 [Botrytis tulipae]|uniref:Uncharacterized protein n=1 Tax=Botrytis tulipae TaxID=87230 RepID=A0A4Z1EM49_9HELO|nr:hypothetical protein BTUL_0070g00240 [Botrytis tulipae]
MGKFVEQFSEMAHNVQGAKKSKSMFKAGKELKVAEDGELHFLSYFLIRFCSDQLPRLAVPNTTRRAIGEREHSV